MPEPGRRQYLAAHAKPAHERGRELVRRLAARHANCSVVPLADLYLDEGRVFVLDGRRLLYVDGDHLGDQGAAYGAARIEAALTARLARE